MEVVQLTQPKTRCSCYICSLDQDIKRKVFGDIISKYKKRKKIFVWLQLAQDWFQSQFNLVNFNQKEEQNFRVWIEFKKGDYFHTCGEGCQRGEKQEYPLFSRQRHLSIGNKARLSCCRLKLLSKTVVAWNSKERKEYTSHIYIFFF